MKIIIVYDNSTFKEELHSGWGFSCSVDQKILFDTGEKSKPLFSNMDRLKIDISKIEAVVISHEHWDHTGGLWALLKKRKGLLVYACPGFSPAFKNKVRKFKGKLIEAKTYYQIDQNFSVTGEIPGFYKGSYIPEQALIVKTEGGITVITGCSHPSIVKIIQNVKKIYPKERILIALGGFHLKDQDAQIVYSIATSLKNMGVEKIGPTHCTGKDAQIILKNNYKNNFLLLSVGKTLEI